MGLSPFAFCTLAKDSEKLQDSQVRGKVLHVTDAPFLLCQLTRSYTPQLKWCPLSHLTPSVKGFGCCLVADF